MDDLTRAECEHILEIEDVAHLGLCDAGEPYVTPMSYIYMDGALYFRTGPGRRLDALRRGGRVCVEISSFERQTDWESVLVWGRPRILTGVETGGEVVAKLLEKYREQIGSPLRFSYLEPLTGLEAIVEISPEEMTGRASGRELRPRTRPGRL